jgi:hypothetical protein
MGGTDCSAERRHGPRGRQPRPSLHLDAIVFGGLSLAVEPNIQKEFHVRFYAVPLFALSIALTSACDDPTGFQVDPLLTTDTIEIAAPNETVTLPSALDVSSGSGVIGGGRYPEQQSDAGQWDLALRRVDGELVFVPAGALGFNERAGITEPIAGTTFEDLREAPPSSAFIDDAPVVVELGAVYAVRSRALPCGFGADGQYAKIQPLEVDAASGRILVQVTTNERCGDLRLVAED